MSDCFDHDEYDDDYFLRYDEPALDRNAYHSWFAIGALIRETEKAFLYQYSDLQVWIAKKLIRKIEPERIFVHRDTFIKIIKTALEGPAMPSEEDFVRVPKTELKKLEETRVELYQLLSKFNDDTWFQLGLLSISNQMWRVANTKIWCGEKNERIEKEDQSHFT